MPLDFDSRTDFDNADRGFIATLQPVTIAGQQGRVAMDTSGYGFLQGECPETVHPSLFRQAQLSWKNGLYEVVEGVYQVRGFDLSNMTLVEGDEGVIVIDPLCSAEPAAAGLALYREHRGNRPVAAVIYSHSHIDHFGGVLSVLPDGAGDVPIIAPEGFLEHAVSENVYAGGAMVRRGMYMAGATIAPGPEGQVSAGLGIATSAGTVGLLPPTLDVTHTGQVETVDGVAIEFQMTPGTEAPAEMNFYIPRYRALCMAENASHTLHNVLTLRGALVRDARAWSRYLDEAIEIFCVGGGESGSVPEVAFGSHHWPTWGIEPIIGWLSEQRDMYAFMHDQTLRALNKGATGLEIAEDFQLPPVLDAAFHVRGYYGSVSHDVKAVYQRYLGWFDGHPTSLWQHPPQAAATRYAEAFGGVDTLVSKGREFADRGDLRFAAELLKHAVFADPDNASARQALADVYGQLGFGAENALWRNFYLTGRHELLHGVTPNPVTNVGGGMAIALTVEQLFDTLAIRLDGLRAAEVRSTIVWRFTDQHLVVRTALSNGALIQTPNPRNTDGADLEVTLTKPQLLGIVGGRGLDGLGTSGDVEALKRLLELLEESEDTFPVVTP
ncbi:alkyl sulfatase dimerization domain-containing protein [Terrabacter lapilli]|uniref:Alkyl sulfatase dimerization domain-containing protein n=1 Tax=Terrabacter lapilli TaxID=436231 RepID=A0ABN2SL96_9MICO